MIEIAVQDQIWSELRSKLHFNLNVQDKTMLHIYTKSRVLDQNRNNKFRIRIHGPKWKRIRPKPDPNNWLLDSKCLRSVTALRGLISKIHIQKLSKLLMINFPRAAWQNRFRCLNLKSSTSRNILALECRYPSWNKCGFILNSR